MSTQLENEFTVPVPPKQAWDTLLDVPRIAPCMPGATLDEVSGDTYTGRVKVKVGPITVTYRGQARLVDQDDEAMRATIEASGKEAKGTGTADARVVATLHPIGEGTRVHILTDLDITGRIAQTGRGLLADVSARLVDRFANNLAELLQQDSAGAGQESAPATAAQDSEASPAATAPRDDRDEALDLVATAAAPVAKRAAIAAGALLVIAVMLRWLLRRRRRTRA